MAKGRGASAAGSGSGTSGAGRGRGGCGRRGIRTDSGAGAERARAKGAAPAAGRDGKFVVDGNDDTLSGEDLALDYKQLQRVERASRTLKHRPRLRPV